MHINIDDVTHSSEVESMPKESPPSDLLPRILRNRHTPRRTTFSMTEHGLEALSWLAGRHSPSTHLAVFKGIAELLDLFSDLTAKEKLLRALPPRPGGKRTRRTFVVDKSDLQLLTRFANDNNLPRDEAVEKLLLYYRVAERASQKARYEEQGRLVELWDKIVCEAALKFEREAVKVGTEPDDSVLDHFKEGVAVILAHGDLLPDDAETSE